MFQPPTPPPLSVNNIQLLRQNMSSMPGANICSIHMSMTVYDYTLLLCYFVIRLQDKIISYFFLIQTIHTIIPFYVYPFCDLVILALDSKIYNIVQTYIIWTQSINQGSGIYGNVVSIYFLPFQYILLLHTPKKHQPTLYKIVWNQI